MKIEGTVAVVTGGAAGIGQATVLALAQRGSDVVVADISEQGAHAVCAEVERLGQRSLPMHTDVSQRADVEALVDAAISWQGHCDIFISNAGVGCSGAPHEFTTQEWEDMLAVNLWPSIWPLRKIVPHMLELGSGHLVFVSSAAGFEGGADRAPYCVAKFGIVGLAESLARYLQDTGVDVSLVVPGAVSTDGWKRYLFAGAEDLDPGDIERRRHEAQAASSGWPRPETMAAAIVDGIAAGKYAVVQHNPHEPDWLANTLTMKGRDPDGFILRR